MDVACIEDGCRDDRDTMNDNDFVKPEETDVREDSNDSIQSARNKISIEDGNICLNFNGDYFKCIDVPGDGDCFNHGILKYNRIVEKLYGAQQLRIYLRDMVNNLFVRDQVLQNLFDHHRIDFVWRCSNVIRMGVWATISDTLLFYMW